MIQSRSRLRKTGVGLIIVLPRLVATFARIGGRQSRTGLSDVSQARITCCRRVPDRTEVPGGAVSKPKEQNRDTSCREADGTHWPNLSSRRLRPRSSSSLQQPDQQCLAVRSIHRQCRRKAGSAGLLAEIETARPRSLRSNEAVAGQGTFLLAPGTQKNDRRHRRREDGARDSA